MRDEMKRLNNSNTSTHTTKETTMSKSTNTSTQSPVDTLKETTLKLDNTSKKIRYLHSQGKTTSQIERLLEDYGVKTKEGRPIRYQFVRNVLNQKTK